MKEDNLPTTDNEEQELQEIPRWLNITLTLISIIIITAGLLSIMLYPISYYLNIEPLNPGDLQSTTLIAVGSLILIILYLPWNKIKFGDFELERAIQDQSQDYSLFIEILKEKIKKLEKERDSFIAVKKSRHPEYVDQDIVEKKSEATEAVGEESKYERLINDKTEKDAKELLYKFLNEWNTYGFTVTRIINWGGNRAGYDAFQNYSPMEMRLIADQLVREGKVRTRLSSNGNILYQIKS